MVWSNLPNQGVAAGLSSCWQDQSLRVSNVPQKMLLRRFWMWQGRGGVSNPLFKGDPQPSPTDLGIHLKISTQFSRILKESCFSSPLWHHWPPCPLFYLSCQWPIISGEKWGENSFFRRIRKCQRSLPRCGCYTPVIACCYCKGFSTRDCLLSCAWALRCIFTTRTDLASLYIPKLYDNKNAS